jgi:hypothetical protein
MVMNRKFLLICIVFAAAGILLTSAVYSTGASAASKSVITSKMCVNGKCEMRVTNSNSSTLGIIDGQNASGSAPSQVKKQSTSIFGESIRETLKKLMGEN